MIKNCEDCWDEFVTDDEDNKYCCRCVPEDLSKISKKKWNRRMERYKNG